MNYGRRRRNRISYSSRSRRRFGSYTSRSARRASGNQRAANQQRDISTVTLNCPTTVIVKNGKSIFTPDIGDNPDYSLLSTEVKHGIYALNIWDVLCRSEFYQAYANMYDQVRIDRVSVKLTPFQFPIYGNGTGVQNYYNNYTVVTAWDRTGLSSKDVFIKYEFSNDNPTDESVGTLNAGTITHRDGLYVNMDGKQVATYSSAITKSVSPNSNTSIRRYIYPTTLAEKAYYVNTSDLKPWYRWYDSNLSRYGGFIRPVGVTGAVASISNSNVAVYPIRTANSEAVADNPTYLVETSEVPFKPTLLVGLLNEITEISQGTDTVTLTPEMKFNVEVDVVCTFRGLRKGTVMYVYINIYNNNFIK